jgi:hypothetical protein
MENTVLIHTQKTRDRDSLVLASLIVKDAKQLVKSIRAIAAVLVRYATIAISISDSLRGCVEPVTTMQYRKHTQGAEVSLRCNSIAKLPLAG